LFLIPADCLENHGKGDVIAPPRQIHLIGHCRQTATGIPAGQAVTAKPAVIANT